MGESTDERMARNRRKMEKGPPIASKREGSNKTWVVDPEQKFNSCFTDIIIIVFGEGCEEIEKDNASDLLGDCGGG